MIDKQQLAECVEHALEGTDVFIVEIKTSPDNNIVVELDSDSSMDVDTCARVTREIEAAFDREVEDYSLEVGSAGLTAPLRTERQYRKNIGNSLDILTADGRKFTALLTEVTPGGITVEVSRKVKEPGAKRPVMVQEPLELTYDNIKKATYHFDFK